VRKMEENVQKLEKQGQRHFSEREVVDLAPPNQLFEKVPAFHQLSAAKHRT